MIMTLVVSLGVVITAQQILIIRLLATTALAAGIMPLGDNIERCEPSLSIKGNTANCSLYVKAINSNDKITATVTLQKENSRGNYTNVKSWPGQKGTGWLSFADKLYSICRR